ncbi:MAG: hypothetical protein OXC98_06200 [bacterium]|nr:hypothetical protein [bacterium]
MTDAAVPRNRACEAPAIWEIDPTSTRTVGENRKLRRGSLRDRD